MERYSHDDYYQPGEAHGYTGGLKYVFGPASYDRLVASVGTSASDSEVSTYADYYFRYDSRRRVTLETVQGAGTTDASDCLGSNRHGEEMGIKLWVLGNASNRRQLGSNCRSASMRVCYGRGIRWETADAG